MLVPATVFRILIFVLVSLQHLQLVLSVSIRYNSESSQCASESYASKPRVFILSDISNEPDDAESLVRYLVYSHQFQTEGLVATTSYWLNSTTDPEAMQNIINAYASVVDNLNSHVHPDSSYPSPEYLLSILKSGPTVYGMAAVGKDIPLSDGARLLLEKLDASDEVLWVPCWGGASVLAQVLFHVRETRSETELNQLLQKLRVYAISDQDDAGPWIRLHFPSLFYIASVHGWNHYGMAAWSGISGDTFYNFDHGGPNTSLVTQEWLTQHIQIGPLGSVYPDLAFIMEGDTPAFLYLIQNGLGMPESPEWGSWGGRYALSDISGRSKHYGDAVDIVVGLNGENFTSNHATIWRWREAYQNDFAARIQWTLSSSYAEANHAPVILLNNTCGVAPFEVSVAPGSTMILDASGTFDPDDGDNLTFKWYQYRDVTATQSRVDAEVPLLVPVILDRSEGRRVSIAIPERSVVCNDSTAECQTFHMILEVVDDGSPALRSYRRTVIKTTIVDVASSEPDLAEHTEL